MAAPPSLRPESPRRKRAWGSSTPSGRPAGRCSTRRTSFPSATTRRPRGSRTGPRATRPASPRRPWTCSASRALSSSPSRRRSTGRPRPTRSPPREDERARPRHTAAPRQRSRRKSSTHSGLQSAYGILMQLVISPPVHCSNFNARLGSMTTCRLLKRISQLWRLKVFRMPGWHYKSVPQSCTKHFAAK